MCGNIVSKQRIDAQKWSSREKRASCSGAHGSESSTACRARRKSPRADTGHGARADSRHDRRLFATETTTHRGAPARRGAAGQARCAFVGRRCLGSRSRGRTCTTSRRAPPRTPRTLSVRAASLAPSIESSAPSCPTASAPSIALPNAALAPAQLCGSRPSRAAWPRTTFARDRRASSRISRAADRPTDCKRAAAACSRPVFICGPGDGA